MRTAIWPESAPAGGDVRSAEHPGSAQLLPQRVLDEAESPERGSELQTEAARPVASGRRATSDVNGDVGRQPIPAIQRDLSIVVEENIRWADIVGAVNSRAPAELENVEFVGIYRGKGIDAGKKCVTLSLRFRDEDGTLTHETVDGFDEIEIIRSESPPAYLQHALQQRECTSRITC